MDTTEGNLSKFINERCKTITNCLLTFPNSIFEIQKRAELSVPLLKGIEEMLESFRGSTNLILENIKILRSLSNIVNEYDLALNI